MKCFNQQSAACLRLLPAWVDPVTGNAAGSVVWLEIGVVCQRLPLADEEKGDWAEMNARQVRLPIILIVLATLVGSCRTRTTPSPALTSSAPSATFAATGFISQTPAVVAPSETIIQPSNMTTSATATPVHPSLTATREPAPTTSPTLMSTAATPSPTGSPSATVQPRSNCSLGTGLREDTVSILQHYKGQLGLVMAPAFRLADTYYPEFEGWTRVLAGPSLEILQKKAERAALDGVPYDALGYGLETSSSTPDKEWQDLIGSTQKAREISDQYGRPLLMAPGFRLMSRNEDKYPEMAALADLWIIQTQRLQSNPPGPIYRREVERVVNLIKSGNPDIAIWAQITFPPDREPNVDEWLAYRESIVDLVDGTYVGVYAWDTLDPKQLVAAIEAIFAACEREE